MLPRQSCWLYLSLVTLVASHLISSHFTLHPLLPAPSHPFPPIFAPGLLPLLSYLIPCSLSSLTSSSLFPSPPLPSSQPNGFFPFGVHGVFDAAAIAYFSYVGYDAVATLAEETVKPARDIPIGIVGSVIIATALYCLLCLSLTFLLPYDQVGPSGRGGGTEGRREEGGGREGRTDGVRDGGRYGRTDGRT